MDSRYEEFSKKMEEKYRGARILEHMHPVVRRTLALRKPTEGDRSEPVMIHRTLLTIDGKEVVKVSAFDHVVQETKPAEAPAASLPSIPEPEVARRASFKSERLQQMLSKQIDEHVRGSTVAFADERWVPTEVKEGFAELAEAQWDVMTEQHLSPAQKAELLHVRNMIKSIKQQVATLNQSLEAFQRAERELLTNTKC